MVWHSIVWKFLFPSSHWHLLLSAAASRRCFWPTANSSRRKTRPLIISAALGFVFGFLGNACRCSFFIFIFFSLAFSQFISDDFGGCKAIRTWPAPDTHTKELLKLPAFSIFHFIFLHFFTALLFCVYLCKDKLSEFSFVFSPGLSPYLCAFLLLSCSCFPAFRWVKQ